MNTTITKIVAIICVFSLFAIIVPNCQGSEEPQQDAQYWQAKYEKQKRKSRGQYTRIKLLNKRIEVLRGSNTPLENAIVKWVNLASCESGNDWHIDSGNGFFGGVQFDRGTWKRYGGSLFGRTANLASPIQQVAIAEQTLKVQGRSAWPACSSGGAW